MNVRLVMWSLFLIEHLYLSGVWQGCSSQEWTLKRLSNVFGWGRTRYLTYTHHPRFKLLTPQLGGVISWRKRWKHLSSNSEMTNWVVRNRETQFTIQSNSLKSSGELELLTIGPHKLHYIPLLQQKPGAKAYIIIICIYDTFYHSGGLLA